MDGETLVYFDADHEGLHFHAEKADKGNALITISRDGEELRRFLWPAYKVWNIAAHASDIAADINHGLAVAGSDGLGGGCVPQEPTS